MTFNSLKRLFTAQRRTDDGRPVPMIWVGDNDEMTLINPYSGRVHAYIWHDGHGKYYPTVVVSPFRAIYLILELDEGELVSLLPLPRCAVEIIRTRSMVEAQQEALQALGRYADLREFNELG